MTAVVRRRSSPRPAATRTLAVRRLHQRIVIREGIAGELAPTLERRKLGVPSIVVTDGNVERHQARRMPSGVPRIVVPPGESSKSFDQVERLSREFARAGLDRTSVVVAIGGGVVNDLAGFAAAVFMRGIRWVAVPTSLLAMVDASVGGKTAVDVPEGKNLVGAFHPASLVLVDPLMLETLPGREWRAGLAEVVKHAVIGAPPLFAALERGMQFGAADHLAAAIEVKRAIVQRDPYERNEREALNFGHTIGHGVEAASGFRLTHGEAVAIGLVGEARLAEKLGVARRGLAERIEAVLLAQGLPMRYARLSPDAVRGAMESDKKKRAGRLRFALPARIGRIVIGVEAPDDTLMDVLREIRR